VSCQHPKQKHPLLEGAHLPCAWPDCPDSYSGRYLYLPPPRSPPSARYVPQDVPQPLPKALQYVRVRHLDAWTWEPTESTRLTLQHLKSATPEGT
jgi:hypothetical protein